MTTPTTLPQQLLALAYAATPTTLDDVARHCGAADWQTFTTGLAFTDLDTGGGCAMHVAQTHGVTLALTDGDAGLPTGSGYYWVGVMEDVFGAELYWGFFREAALDAQGGELLDA
ncbi:hypothetical protein [Deinococcus sp. Leaf326]|uniref:hypothetical protein n=1 Tax=Deinococcus sp. Leaf326 TaxID=1736338 RepID=UPI0006F21454|nr:hypothetical protein [Deinococcus sp. Leaf326]KQR37698.1 hypothetical protein ASF71_14550 [Deinococcus sp. Leaf326]